MAAIDTGSRVLDIAAGAGDQSLLAARRTGPDGHVLATDISSNILEYAAAAARAEGLAQLEHPGDGRRVARASSRAASTPPSRASG